MFSPFGKEEIKRVMLIFFISTFLIPALSIVIFKITHSISSLKLENLQERRLPFVFILIFYGMTTYLFAYQLKVSGQFLDFMVMITSLIALSTMITLFWKISIHSLSLGGGLTMLLVLSSFVDNRVLIYLVAGVSLISGFVMTGRLYLKAHTSAQVWVGFFSGVALVIGLYYVLK